jgi:hypothetical protein
MVWGQPEKKLSSSPSQQIVQMVVVHTCNPSYTGGTGRRIMFQGWPRKKCETVLGRKKKYEEQKGLEAQFKR